MTNKVSSEDFIKAFGNGVKDNREIIQISEVENDLNMREAYEAGYEAGYEKAKTELNERPKGEWIDEGQYAEGHSEHAYICKKCGYQIIANPNMIFENRYCKYCGADMRKENRV